MDFYQNKTPDSVRVSDQLLEQIKPIKIKVRKLRCLTENKQFWVKFRHFGL